MVTSFPASADDVRGGVAAVAYQLCTSLLEIDESLEVEVLAVDSSADFRALDGTHERLRVLAAPRGRFPEVYRSAVGLPSTTAVAIRARRPDIVHVQGVACFLKGVEAPSVLTFHGIPEKTALFAKGNWLTKGIRSFTIRTAENRYRQRADHGIIINPYVEAELRGFLPARTTFIENPVRREIFAVDRAPEADRVLFVGVLRPIKAFDRLIAGFANFSRTRPSARLCVAGSTPDAAYLRRCRGLAERLGCEDRIEYLGNLSINALCEQFSRASLLALCSNQETAPVAISEAMAAGLPVVAMDRFGIPYLVRHGETGILVKTNDTEELSAALAAASKPGFMARAEGIARREAKRRFWPSEVALATRRVYSEVLATRATVGRLSG